MKTKAIIIDDEIKAISSLTNILNNSCPHIEIVNSYQNPEKALEEVPNISFDILFLDISMPRISGFDFLRQIENKNFEIIFVTAHDEYAIQAIKNCAIGYILKPIFKDELIDAVSRAEQNIKQKTYTRKNNVLIENISTQDPYNRKLGIPSNDGIEFYEIKDIIHLEGYKGYTKIHIKNSEAIISSYNLGYYTQRLDKKYFYKVHKSHIISIKEVKKYLNEGYIELHNGEHIPISKNKKYELLEMLAG